MEKKYTDAENPPLTLMAVSQPMVNQIWLEAKEWQERATIAEATVAAMRTVMENEHKATTKRVIREHVARMNEE